jgi:alpha-beta hydrolase superfamily lysophospholipase
MTPVRRLISKFARRKLATVAAVLTGLVALWLLSATAVAYRLTSRPQAPYREPAPAVAWGQVEPVRLQTADGEAIGGWYVTGDDDQPSILLLHANGQSRTALLPLIEMFAGEGYSVLAISIRAHGDSTGDRNDFGYGARHDVLAAVAYLERRRPGREVFVQGTSLGAAAAIFAASDLSARITGYILESPYCDLRTAVRNRTAIYLPRPLDYVGYIGLSLVAGAFVPEMNRLAPAARIADIPATIPILFMAGGRDEHVRVDEIEAIQSKVALHSRLIVFAEAGHESFYLHSPESYREHVLDFIHEALVLQSR